MNTIISGILFLLFQTGIQAVPLEASSDISTPSSTNISESNDSASNITDISSADSSNGTTLEPIIAIGPNQNLTDSDLTDRMRQKEELRRQILALLDDLDKAIPDNSTKQANETSIDTLTVDNTTLVNDTSDSSSNETLDTSTESSDDNSTAVVDDDKGTGSSEATANSSVTASSASIEEVSASSSEATISSSSENSTVAENEDTSSSISTELTTTPTA